MVSTELPARRRIGFIAHGVNNNHGGKRQMGRISRSAVRDFCLLISVVQLEANRQADVLVDTLHCKTEQLRASVLCQLGVQLAATGASRPRSRAGRPIDIVSNLFDPPIYLSKPSTVATSPFSESCWQQGYYFWQITHTQLRYSKNYVIKNVKLAVNSVIWKSKIALQFLKIALR